MPLNRSRYRKCEVIGPGPSVLPGLWALVCLCLMPPLAQAAIETFDPSVTPASTSYSSADVKVPQFDPSLGTLNSISIVAKGTGNFTQFFENAGPSAGQLSIGQSVHMVLDMPDKTTPILSINQSESHTYSFTPFDGNVDFGGTSGEKSTSAISASGNGVITSASGLLQFTGNGFTDLYLNADGEINLPSGLTGGNLIVGGLLTAGAQFTIQYDYSAVPEASTWLGAAAALLGLVLGWRRSARKRV
jgi:hypothetical protein